MHYMQVRMSSPNRRERWKKLPRAFGEDRLVEDDRYKLGVRVEPRCTRPPRAGVVERTHARTHASTHSARVSPVALPTWDLRLPGDDHVHVPHPRGVRRNRPERRAQLACTRKQRARRDPFSVAAPQQENAMRHNLTYECEWQAKTRRQKGVPPSPAGAQTNKQMHKKWHTPARIGPPRNKTHSGTAWTGRYG